MEFTETPLLETVIFPELPANTASLLLTHAVPVYVLDVLPQFVLPVAHVPVPLQYSVAANAGDDNTRAAVNKAAAVRKRIALIQFLPVTKKPVTKKLESKFPLFS
jgi:hypothetical protein